MLTKTSDIMTSVKLVELPSIAIMGATGFDLDFRKLADKNNAVVNLEKPFSTEKCEPTAYAL